MQKLPIAHLERNHIKAQPLEVAAFLYRQGDHVIIISWVISETRSTGENHMGKGLSGEGFG